MSFIGIEMVQPRVLLVEFYVGLRECLNVLTAIFDCHERPDRSLGDAYRVNKEYEPAIFGQ